MKTLEIGKLKLKNPVFLAPMADITNSPLRLLAKQLGCSLVHTEMVSADGLFYGNNKSIKLLWYTPQERPIVLQLFTADIYILLKATEIALCYADYDAIEINMACPMKNITKKGAGAFLLQKPELSYEMINSLKKHFSKPVWAKIRILEDKQQTIDFIDKLINAGADAVIVHGRTPKQKYSGKADKDFVCNLAKLFKDKIIATGDVWEEKDALKYLQNNCKAVLVARGFLKNPFIIEDILYYSGYIKTKKEKNFKDLLYLILTLGKTTYKNLGENECKKIMKKMFCMSVRNAPSSAFYRHQIGKAESYQKLREIILNYMEFLENKNLLDKPLQKGVLNNAR